MRNYSPFFVLIFCLTSCSNNSFDERAAEENLILVELNGPIICSGYGIYEDSTYDCGWKKGYDDWVAQYNAVAGTKADAECLKIKVKVIEVGGKIKATTTTTSKGTAKSIAIIQETQNLNQDYYNDLFNNTNGSYFQGKIAGYLAGRGQQPYAENASQYCD